MIAEPPWSQAPMTLRQTKEMDVAVDVSQAIVPLKLREHSTLIVAPCSCFHGEMTTHKEEVKPGPGK